MTAEKPAIPPIPTKRPAAPKPPPSSTGLIQWGVVALIVGQILYNAGRQSQLSAAMNPYATDSGSGPLILIGGLITLAGLVLAVRGLLRVASRIDFLYHRNGGQ
ncbi:hypothetical protein H9623_06970 [Oerskovia sp. Sa1BUA8]|uniref:Uncharacterized protein n=1 Tax=Oerskovia douganii TaxID=2762210 RepID=A0A9D5U8C3_9CELL|nr:hypothetical protein [Oerskovia douganii]MBE7700048.1 hypothetical protein [Oerskovia douganii]